MSGLSEALLGPPEQVAPRLLGAVLRHGPVAVRITEVEAYAGPDDPGSHAYRGRTARNGVMFGPAGRLYCYLSHGIHTCANVVVGEPDVPTGILLRAGEVIAGLDVARDRRPDASDRDLARGPGRLCRALAIEVRHDGTDLAVGPITLTLGPEVGGDLVSAGPRVGLRQASTRAWRYWLTGESTVSAYRRHPAADTGD